MELDLFIRRVSPARLKIIFKSFAKWVLNHVLQRRKNSCSALFGLCPGCREKDSYKAFSGLVKETRQALIQAGLPFIENQHRTNEFQFLLPEERQTDLEAVLKSMKKRMPLSIAYRNVTQGSNKYEVDGTSLTIPQEAGCWEVYQKGSCNKDLEQLKRWNIQVSFYTDFDNARLFHHRNNIVRVLPLNQKIPDTLENLWKQTKGIRIGVLPLQLEKIKFPVDIVYTWVDDLDKSWEEKRLHYASQVDLEEERGKELKSSANPARFRNRDELLYSLRSVYMYAPFVRRIFIITDDQIPSWLDINCGKVKVIYHKNIFDDETIYPVFSSRPIEFNLHHIPDLSEHFIYMNDDFFFCSPVNADDFFFCNGIAKIYPSSRLLDSRPVQPLDRATVASHKNAAAAFERYFGVSPTGKYKHAPYSVRRSACYEIEQVFTDEVKASKRNRFRSWDDLSWSYVTPHYMLYKGYAVPQDISSHYVDVHDTALPAKLLSVSNSNEIKFLCINDADGEGEAPHEKYLLEWMDARFPVKAPWEGICNA